MSILIGWYKLNWHTNKKMRILYLSEDLVNSLQNSFIIKYLYLVFSFLSL